MPPKKKQRKKKQNQKNQNSKKVKPLPCLLFIFVSTDFGLPAQCNIVHVLQSFQQGVCVFGNRHRGAADVMTVKQISKSLNDWNAFRKYSI